MFTIRKTNQIDDGSGENIAGQITVSADLRTGFQKAVPDASTDLEILVNIKESTLVAFGVISDQDVTIETNNGTTPTDTISLNAGQPVTWIDGELDAAGAPVTAPITGDVTAIYVTNASGAAATVRLFAANTLA